MKFLTEFVSKELTHYRKLSPFAQKLVKSYALADFTGPLLGVFLNAFLLRYTQSFISVAMFNCGIFIGIPVGFYLTGLLIKKFEISKIYLISCILPAISIIPVLIMGGSLILLFGFIQGITFGLYWFNRNIFTYDSTHDHNRNYFSGLTTSIYICINIIVPAVIGWFIVAGSYNNIYSPKAAYYVLFIVAVVILVFAGKLVTASDVTQKPVKLMIDRVSKRWLKLRFVVFIYGIKSGFLFFIPGLIILRLIGDESVLGIVQSLCSVLAAVVVYTLGKKVLPQQRSLIFTLSICIFVLASWIFSGLFSLVGTLVFISLNTISYSIDSFAYVPILYENIDKDNSDASNYARLCDHEVFLNFGRLIAGVIFIGLIYVSSEVSAIRFIPIIVGLSQLILIYFINDLMRYKEPQS